MPNYTVQSQAIQLSTLYSEPYQIRNSGKATIYLGKDTSVSSTQYDWSLSPGDTLGFGANTYLYLICAPGETSTLEQQYGALGNFTPAPGDIISKASNNVTEITPPGGFTITYSAAANTYTTPGFPHYDVSQYSSIILTVFNSAAPGFISNPANYYKARIFFSDSEFASTSQGATYEPQWLLNNPPIIDGGVTYQRNLIQIPVTGRYIRMLPTLIKAATATGGTLIFQLYGSSEVITKPKYYSSGADYDSGLNDYKLFSRTQTVIGPTYYFTASTGGPAAVSIMRDNNTYSTFFNLYAYKSGTLTVVNQLILLAGANIFNDTINVYLPFLPLYIGLKNYPTSGTPFPFQATITKV